MKTKKIFGLMIMMLIVLLLSLNLVLAELATRRWTIACQVTAYNSEGQPVGCINEGRFISQGLSQSIPDYLYGSNGEKLGRMSGGSFSTDTTIPAPKRTNEDVRRSALLSPGFMPAGGTSTSSSTQSDKIIMTQQINFAGDGNEYWTDGTKAYKISKSCTDNCDILATYELKNGKWYLGSSPMSSTFNAAANAALAVAATPSPAQQNLAPTLAQSGSLIVGKDQATTLTTILTEQSPFITVGNQVFYKTAEGVYTSFDGQNSFKLEKGADGSVTVNQIKVGSSSPFGEQKPTTQFFTQQIGAADLSNTRTFLGGDGKQYALFPTGKGSIDTLISESTYGIGAEGNVNQVGAVLMVREGSAWATVPSKNVLGADQAIKDIKDIKVLFGTVEGKKLYVDNSGLVYDSNSPTGQKKTTAFNQKGEEVPVLYPKSCSGWDTSFMDCTAGDAMIFENGQWRSLNEGESFTSWKWNFKMKNWDDAMNPKSGKELDAANKAASLGLFTFDMLNTVSSALSGYTWPTLFYPPDAQETLIGDANSYFYKTVLGGKEAWTSYLCLNAISNSDDTQVALSSYGGINMAASWMAGEKIPYSNFKDGSSGYIYKISGQVEIGKCSKADTQFFVDSVPLKVYENTSEPYTYTNGVDFTNTNMMVFYSTHNYNQVCINFVDFSQGCFINVDPGQQMCWPIKVTGTSTATLNNAPTRQNAQGTTSTSGTSSGSSGGPTTNSRL